MAMHWLYRTEAKGIQGYVLATDKLREMAGASALVEALPEGIQQVIREVAGDAPDRVKEVAVAAGHATLRFRDERDLRKLRATWPLRVAKACPGLKVVQVWTKIGEGKDGMAGALRRLGDLAREEQTRPQVDLPEAGPWVARAGRTGLPAVVTNDRATLRDGKVDAATFAKLRRVGDGSGDALGNMLRPEDAPPFALTHDDLGEGYVGVIHADGNGVGALLVAEEVPADRYGDFSTGLTKATLNAAKAAVQDLWDAVRENTRTPGSSREDPLPVRPIVLGGDDFTVVVKAKYAIRFANVFLQAFERETVTQLGEILGRGLTAAAGIALAKVSFPFHQAYQLAESLCSAAKKPRVPIEEWPDNATPSRLLFHRVTTSAVRTWPDIQRKELRTGPNRDRLLVAGPWSLPQMPRLSKLANALGKLPRGAVRTWLGLTLENFPQADAHWLRAREVLGARAAKDLAEIDGALGALGVKHMTLWTNQGTTPMAEAVTWRSLDSDVLLGPGPAASPAAQEATV